MAPASLDIQQKFKHCLIFAGLREGYGLPTDPMPSLMYIIPHLSSLSQSDRHPYLPELH